MEVVGHSWHVRCGKSPLALKTDAEWFRRPEDARGTLDYESLCFEVVWYEDGSCEGTGNEKWMREGDALQSYDRVARELKHRGLVWSSATA